MDLSYEETMRRGYSYERCNMKHYPWDVSVFKGENQIIVVPQITTIGNYSTYMAWHILLSEPISAKAIGEAVIKSFEHIRISPVDARTTKERNEDFFYLKATNCKSYRAFNRKYLLCIVHMHEQGNFSIAPCESIGSNGGYGGISDDIRSALPSTVSAEDIGRTVIAYLEFAEEHERTKKHDPYSPVKIDLLSEKKVKIFPPRNSHFTDCDDCGAAELYKVYKYYPNEGAESSAEFYLGIAPELDCDMSEDNIRKALENRYGKADFFEVKSVEHGIWRVRAEMRNKSVHRISYLLQIDESDLLDCTMELRKPNSRKKLDEKLSGLFEEFAFKCKCAEKIANIQK